MEKKKIAKAVIAGVIVAELAVLDYCAYMVMTQGVTIEISQEELTEAGQAAVEDMKEGE